jgi:hypothetical protein
MARTPQTQAKRARELALKEKRERKREKKEETADERAARRSAAAEERNGSPLTDAQEHSARPSGEESG